ncbi:hypothetical protein [Paenibacillus paeoniae]|nr:hypothetical protein [Paenibacillus paeoniae]
MNWKMSSSCKQAPSVTLRRDSAHQQYPLATDAAAKSDVLVGRML